MNGVQEAESSNLSTQTKTSLIYKASGRFPYFWESSKIPKNLVL